MSKTLVNTTTTLQECPTSADVQVCRIDDTDEWDSLVSARCDAPLFQRSAWERVWAEYRLPVYRLVASQDAEVVGLLQLVRQRSRITGDQLVSLPWFDCAGISADHQNAASALAEGSLQLANDIGADWVQLRQNSPSSISRHIRTDKVLMRLALEEDPDKLWKRLKPKVRNQVRKAEKAGLKVERGGAELVPDFFDVYSTNMRDLGSPSHARRFFDAIAGEFAAETRVYVVRLAGQAVAAGWTMANGDVLEIPWASSLQKFNGMCANHLMYWQIFEDACREGYECFHFGRSTPGSGQHRFKKQWGAQEVPLFWYFLSMNDREAAQAAHPPGERHGWGTKIWRKLPLFASRRIGPLMIAGIP